MTWDGGIIRTRLDELSMTQAALAESLKVDRVTISNWISGRIPKGMHLLNLCKTLNISPNSFFETEGQIVQPLHRTTRGKPVTPESQAIALDIISEYKSLFFKNDNVDLIPVLSKGINDLNKAQELALLLRKTANVTENQPMEFKTLFRLLDTLKIIPVFRRFPEGLKSYAFYYKIDGYRVVFVNTEKNILDLIFPLLHDAVHALRDEAQSDYSETEEEFCDTVANYTQFPDGYVTAIADRLRRQKPGVKINILKEYAENYGHSLYGIAKRLKLAPYRIIIPDTIGAADTKMKQGTPSIGQILFKSNSATEYVSALKRLSPHFYTLLKSRIDSAGDRVFANWAGLDTGIDGAELKRAFLQD